MQYENIEPSNFGWALNSYEVEPSTKQQSANKFQFQLIYLLFLVIFFCALVLNEGNGQYLLGSKFKDFSILELTVIAYLVGAIPLEIRQVIMASFWWSRYVASDRFYVLIYRSKIVQLLR